MSVAFFFLLCRLTVFDLVVGGYIRGLWGGNDVDEMLAVWIGCN